MVKINEKILQNKIDENLKLIFKPYLKNRISYYYDTGYYHFLDENLYDFLNNYLTEVDSIYMENIDSLEGKLGQYVYLSYFGEVISKDWFERLKTDGEFDDKCFSFHCLEDLKDTTKWVSNEMRDEEPFNYRNVDELILIKSYLEIYNELI